MPTITISKPVEIAVKYLKAECGVRYWEDAEVDGVVDEDGSRIPSRVGDDWCPVIDLETGVVENWPSGIIASTHYKVCDAGRYALLDADRNEVCAVAGYVPEIMSPGGRGHGDYVIMKIGPDGVIENWRLDLEAFSGGAAK